MIEDIEIRIALIDDTILLEQQILRIARESTPAQRIEWVEEMLELMELTGEPYLVRKHKLREIK